MESEVNSQLPLPPVSNLPSFLASDDMVPDYTTDGANVDETASGERTLGDTNMKTTKSLLFFPVRGSPSVINLARKDLDKLNFAPFLTVRAFGKSSPGLLRRTYVGTTTSQNFMLVYGLQTTRNRALENEYVTRALGTFAGGVRRPWVGSLIADFDDESILDAGELDTVAYRVLNGLHIVYERLHPNNSLGFVPVPDEMDVKYFSSDDLFWKYGGDARAAVSALW
ncbi:hypothetical protein VNI00_017907 [Paramarasmius palmivorus]|uniref:Uncharacterized protein n=1 Tax=Paramarasmius palmivorus TaxID=297713 RepID=A0AAW0B228_9AGAR